MNLALVLSGAAALIQALSLFILAGIFKRIERLEDYIMGGKWTGHNRRGE